MEINEWVWDTDIENELQKELPDCITFILAQSANDESTRGLCEMNCRINIPSITETQPGVILMNVRGNHWNGMVIYQSNRKGTTNYTVIFNDPLGSSLKELKDTIVGIYMETIINYVSSEYGITVEVIDLQCKLQHDSISCAPLTAKFLVTLAKLRDDEVDKRIAQKN